MVVKFSEVFLLNKEVSKLFIGTKLKKNILVLLNINKLKINKELTYCALSISYFNVLK